MLSILVTVAKIGLGLLVCSPYLFLALSSINKDCSIIKVGSSILVDQAELKLRNKPISISVIEKELTPFLDIKNLDYLVLGCTHFSHLKKSSEHLLLDNCRNFH